MTQRTTAVLPSVCAVLLLFAANLAAQTTVIYQPTPYPASMTNGIHILDDWFSSSYENDFQKDDKLQIGGWMDNYNTYIQFDTEGLPANVSSAQLRLYAYPRGDKSTLVNFDVWSPNTTWAPNLSTTMDWDSQPSSFAFVGSYSAGQVNNFWNINITSLYNGWRSTPSSNRGLALMSWTQNNNFDVWRSSRYMTNITERPALRLTFTPPVGMPNFKMPLPGGASWLLTTEIGGYECKPGQYNPDSTHQGDNYFTLDFSAENTKDGGGSYSSPIPVLAASGGTVKSVGSGTTTGYYIILDHGNGYLTRYLHFDHPAARKNGTYLTQGDYVNQGDQIGIMGGSGTSTGTHLHMNFWHNATFKGASTVTNLSYVVMDGLLLKSYQTECSTSSSGEIVRIRKYHSTNTPTGI